MNCKLCGYYYSTHEKGTVCQHCGGNRDGLKKTRLMTISKIIAGIALITPSIDFVYAFFFTVPCVLFLLAGITAMIDKQNQKVKNKK